MKKVLYSGVFVLALALTSCGSEETADQHSHEGHNHNNVSGKEYACPMKCEGENIYSEEGECPVCHMDLEVVK